MSLKRVLDVILAFIILVVLSPFFVFIAAWIKFDSKGEVFYRQTRVGKDGNLFRISKFRTMTVGADKGPKVTVGNDIRITKCGKFLRKYKLDELPQFFDVLKGEMSIVGPRPEVLEYINCYPDDVKAKVLSVRPGITDLASIQMVDENEILSKYDNPLEAYVSVILPIKQKYYLEYVENHSVLLDFKIMFLTFAKIICR